MLEDLLVVLGDGAGDDAAVRSALFLAERTEARVAALVPVSLHSPLGFEWGAVPDDLVARLREAERARAGAMAERLRALAPPGARFEVRVQESEFLSRAAIAVMQARHADLSVIARPGDDAGRTLAESMFEELLMESGGPVLVVPPEAPLAQRHAVVAWRPTREASRAVRDALPLLQHYARVDVLVIEPRAGERQFGPQPGSDIAAHLARHGLDVQLVAMPNLGEPNQAAILRHVVEAGADLVVAGGYGHSRFREFWLGGVTRSLLEHCPVPVFFSH